MGFLEEIGQTPLVTIDGIFVKLECSNPGGSVKDRIAKFMVQEAQRRGELQSGDVIVEATSGNTGIALSMVARELGHRVIIFMPEHMSLERRRMLEALGAEIRLTPREEGFEGPVQRRDRYRNRPGYYVPDQFGNPDNSLCHQLTTGQELLTQLRGQGCRKLDVFVAGVGTGGTLMGVSRALRSLMPEVQIVAVEPQESDVMSGGCAGEHGIQGIGDGFIPDLVRFQEVDGIVCVQTADAKNEADAIRKRFGFCVGMSSGANLFAAHQFRDQGLQVATLWPDCADRYVSMGLQSPASAEVHCPLRSGCAERINTLSLGFPKSGSGL
jgi:cysteine synthase A